MASLKADLSYLSQFYPSLYIFILKKFGKIARLIQYMEKCKEFENDPNRYCFYVHGYLLPMFENQRATGLIKQCEGK